MTFQRMKVQKVLIHTMVKNEIRQLQPTLLWFIQMNGARG